MKYRKLVRSRNADATAAYSDGRDSRRCGPGAFTLLHPKLSYILLSVNRLREKSQKKQSALNPPMKLKYSKTNPFSGYLHIGAPGFCRGNPCGYPPSIYLHAFQDASIPMYPKLRRKFHPANRLREKHTKMGPPFSSSQRTRFIINSHTRHFVAEPLRLLVVDHVQLSPFNSLVLQIRIEYSIIFA